MALLQAIIRTGKQARPQICWQDSKEDGNFASHNSNSEASQSADLSHLDGRPRDWKISFFLALMLCAAPWIRDANVARDTLEYCPKLNAFRKRCDTALSQ